MCSSQKKGGEAGGGRGEAGGGKGEVEGGRGKGEVGGGGERDQQTFFTDMTVLVGQTQKYSTPLERANQD